jgi:hypothetical protein
MEPWAKHVCDQRHKPEIVERISYQTQAVQGPT